MLFLHVSHNAYRVPYDAGGAALSAEVRERGCERGHPATAFGVQFIAVTSESPH